MSQTEEALELLEKILKPLDACEPQCKLSLNPEKIRKVITLLRKAPEPKCKTCGDTKKKYLLDKRYKSVEYAPPEAITIIPCPDCQQPTAGDFTKAMREKWLPKPINIDRILSEAVSTIAVACDRLDASEAISKIKDKRIAEFEAMVKAGGECCDMLQERIDVLSEGKAKAKKEG